MEGLASTLRVCAAVLKQLDDKSNDVQSIAVKWYVPTSYPL